MKQKKTVPFSTIYALLHCKTEIDGFGICKKCSGAYLWLK